jgi:diguanylate cyclase (GGDEF)-like protein
VEDPLQTAREIADQLFVTEPWAGNNRRADAERRLALLERAIAATASDADPTSALGDLLEAAVEALQVSKMELRPDSPYGEGPITVERSSPARSTTPITLELVSNGHRHGELAAWCDPAPDPERDRVLATFCQLAASALATAAVREQAQRDAATSQVLLDLSAALGDVGSVEEVTTRLARAVPRLVDCDRAAVVLFPPDGDEGRIEGLIGYEDSDVVFLSSLKFAVAESERDQDIAYYDVTTANKLVRSLMAGTGSIACVSVPINIDGDTVGFVVATVTSDAERLRPTDRKTELLRALAGQASTAIRNTRLLDQVHHQATHDALTGLPNRTLILDRAERMLARAHRTAVVPAVLFLDLDGFKDINDTLGHAVGDQVLRAVAERLTLGLRDEDSIGRLGGDEFVVLVEANAATGDASFVARRLLETLDAPIELPGHELPLRISASIGIATGLRASANELLRDADVALYRAKAMGRGRYVVFAPSMHLAVRERVQLEADLRAARDEGQFFLAYQPMFDLRDYRLCGAEALLRWNHPQRGLVAPSIFVPLLEESRLIVDVGRWILEQACTSASQWRSQGHLIDISVNVSARELEEADFVDEVAQVTRRADLDPSALVLEVTESTLMRDPDLSRERLRELKCLGVKLAVDGVGTGYSSLAQVRRFPVDVLKIDRSFVATMGTSVEGEALVRTLVEYAKVLGLTTVAVGIEDHLQFARLRREQLDRGQGYLLSHPLEGPAFEAARAETSEHGLGFV